MQIEEQDSISEGSEEVGDTSRTYGGEWEEDIGNWSVRVRIVTGNGRIGSLSEHESSFASVRLVCCGYLNPLPSHRCKPVAHRPSIPT